MCIRDSGASVVHVCEVYGVKKQTVSDIQKNKDKLIQFSLKYSVDSSKNEEERKHIKLANTQIPE